MTADIVHADNPALARHARKTTPAAALAALGIVYGDLGTSPLYTLQAVLTATGGHFSPEAALVSLSLIFWALIITISIKYCLFVMRADNHGEGGILALMSMTGANWSEGQRPRRAQRRNRCIQAACGLDCGRYFVCPVRHPEPRHCADRQGVRAGDAAVVRGRRRAGRCRHFPLSRGDCRRRSALRDRAAGANRLERE